MEADMVMAAGAGGQGGIGGKVLAAKAPDGLDGAAASELQVK